MAPKKHALQNCPHEKHTRCGVRRAFLRALGLVLKGLATERAGKRTSRAPLCTGGAAGTHVEALLDDGDVKVHAAEPSQNFPGVWRFLSAKQAGTEEAIHQVRAFILCDCLRSEPHPFHAMSQLKKGCRMSKASWRKSKPTCTAAAEAVRSTGSDPSRKNTSKAAPCGRRAAETERENRVSKGGRKNQEVFFRPRHALVTDPEDRTSTVLTARCSSARIPSVPWGTSDGPSAEKSGGVGKSVKRHAYREPSRRRSRPHPLSYTSPRRRSGCAPRLPSLPLHISVCAVGGSQANKLLQLCRAIQGDYSTGVQSC